MDTCSPILESLRVACIQCGRGGTLVDQYQEQEGGRLLRRFLCLPCYGNLSSKAKLFDQSFKAKEVPIPVKPPPVKKRDLPKVPKAPKPVLPAKPVVASPARKLLDYILRQSRKGNSRQGIQHVLEVTDDWMREANWGYCGALLNEADPEQLSVTMSLGLLTACHPCRALIKEPRQRFIEALRTHLSRTRPQDMEILMQGLE